METVNKPKRIIYCLSSLYKAGGMERVVTNKANYLARHGFEITIITTDQKQRKPYFDLHPAIARVDLGINYEDSNGKGLFHKLSTYPKRQRLHRSLLQGHLLRLKADMVISLFDHDVSFLWRLKDSSHKILEIHFSRFKRVQYGKKGIWAIINKYRSQLDLKYVKKYRRFVVLTEEDRSYWGNLKNLVVIPNANSFQTESLSPLNQKVVIAVGRLDHQKRFEDLIQAWALVCLDFPDWQLHIFGDGEQKSFLQDLINSWNLSRNIRLCAPVHDIKAEYLNSSIAAMTSRYEGLPMALLEAQACGLPMVSYACKCGPRDIIESGKNGFLVTEGDIPAFAERLKQLMGNDELRYTLGLKAKFMSQRFTEEKVMQKWLKLFNEVQR
ncbi:MAG: glycosyl transferase family 1 [Sphingobacterium sp.]|jgi:glycosyltransferase involved in cell wall biosynthesis|nr:glycosyl transferase family 1 [Sphingobacterium sp.]